MSSTWFSTMSWYMEMCPTWNLALAIESEDTKEDKLWCRKECERECFTEQGAISTRWDRCSSCTSSYTDSKRFRIYRLKVAPIHWVTMVKVYNPYTLIEGLRASLSVTNVSTADHVQTHINNSYSMLGVELDQSQQSILLSSYYPDNLKSYDFGSPSTPSWRGYSTK